MQRFAKLGDVLLSKSHMAGEHPVLAPTLTPVLSVDRVWVRFKSFVALRGLSLQLHSGQLLGLIGPNGAGKTTLLRTIAGLQEPTHGTVRIAGRILDPEKPDGFELLGFTPDTPPLYPTLTVRQTLRCIGKGYGLSPAESDDRIDFWLEKVWLSEKADTKISALSRGMRQRVGIARALLPNPSVILLDEPAAGLDPAGRVQFRKLLIDLRNQGKTIIVSSHILADMDAYCTHIGIMSAGELVQFGTVQQISGSTAAAGRCRYEMKLVRAIPDLSAVLQAIDRISAVQIDQVDVVFEFDSNHEAAASLVKHLVLRDIPIAAFAPQASGLEDAYLRTGIAQVE